MSTEMRAAPSSHLPILHQLALLAGLGPRASDVLGSLAAPLPGAEGRTCIDAGAPAVLALRAPGRRRFDVHIRDRTSAANEHRWTGVRTDPEGPDQRFRRWLFTDRAGRAAELATSAADHLGAGDRIRAIHRSLGPLGRIWSLTVDASTVEVSWQLDRDVPPEVALRAFGNPDAWPLAASVIDDVVDGGPRTGPGPWSVGVLLTGSPPTTVRVGTTRWARLPDDDDKVARLAAVVDRHGGDASFATAAYRLLLAASRGTGHPAGRAVEVDVSAGHVLAAHAYLTVPTAMPSRFTEGSPR
jgi:hypothetical protein